MTLNRAHMSWQRRLRREIGWLLLAKIAALAILWALFFSPSHRTTADDGSIAHRLAVAPAANGRPNPRSDVP
jgi:hypothetical protein